MLDRAKIDYEVKTFELEDGHMDGERVAELVGENVVYNLLLVSNYLMALAVISFH
jgi:Cys-tRNA(Pro)/Cys-tRNA(Cys) deacylase